MKRRNTQLGNNKLLSIAAREEERKRRNGGEKKWEEWEAGGRDKGWEEHKAERRWRMYIYILYTRSMTDLHAIVVNSFVF